MLQCDSHDMKVSAILLLLVHWSSENCRAPPVFYISDISDVYDVRCVTSGGLHSAASALLLHLTN